MLNWMDPGWIPSSVLEFFTVGIEIFMHYLGFMSRLASEANNYWLYPTDFIGRKIIFHKFWPKVDYAKMKNRLHDELKCSIVKLQIYGLILYLIQFQVDSSPLNPTVNLHNRTFS